MKSPKDARPTFTGISHGFLPDEGKGRCSGGKKKSGEKANTERKKKKNWKKREKAGVGLLRRDLSIQCCNEAPPLPFWRAQGTGREGKGSCRQGSEGYAGGFPWIATLPIGETWEGKGDLVTETRDVNYW